MIIEKHLRIIKLCKIHKKMMDFEAAKNECVKPGNDIKRLDIPLEMPLLKDRQFGSLSDLKNVLCNEHCKVEFVTLFVSGAFSTEDAKNLMERVKGDFLRSIINEICTAHERVCKLSVQLWDIRCDMKVNIAMLTYLQHVIFGNLILAENNIKALYLYDMPLVTTAAQSEIETYVDEELITLPQVLRDENCKICDLSLIESWYENATGLELIIPADLPKKTQLGIDVTETPLNPADFQNIISAVETGKIKRLSLAYETVTQEDFDKLFEALKNDANILKELRLLNSDFHDVSQLVSVLQDENNKLRVLEIIDHCDLVPLQRALGHQNCHLEQVKLWSLDDDHNRSFFDTLHDDLKVTRRKYDEEDKSATKAQRKLKLKEIPEPLGNIRKLRTAMPLHDLSKLLKLSGQFSILRCIGMGDQPVDLITRFNQRLESKWFHILLLLLNFRTRPPLFLKEFVNPLGLAWYYNGEEEE